MTTTKTTNPFILGLIIAMGFVVGYFYYSSTKLEIVESPAGPNISDPEYLKFKTLTFDLEFFKKEKFSSLKQIGEFPINPGTTGKQNLFAQ